MSGFTEAKIKQKAEFDRKVKAKRQAFLETVNSVLSHQNEEQKQDFIEGVFNDPRLDFAFYPMIKGRDIDVESQKSALSAAKKLKLYVDSGVVHAPIKYLEEAIHILKFEIACDEALNTGGDRSQLTSHDLMVLGLLQKHYAKNFPKKPSHYKRANLLYKLGSELIDKSIPDSVNRLLQKYSEIAGKIYT
jgi:hypothetical protein